MKPKNMKKIMKKKKHKGENVSMRGYFENICDEKIFQFPINGIISGLAHIFHSAFITPKTKYWCALAQDAEGNEYVPYTDYSAVEKIADENGTYETRWAQSKCI
jgi:hypothetical protein